MLDFNAFKLIVVRFLPIRKVVLLVTSDVTLGVFGLSLELNIEDWAIPKLITLDVHELDPRVGDQADRVDVECRRSGLTQREVPTLPYRLAFQIEDVSPQIVRESDRDQPGVKGRS